MKVFYLTLLTSLLSYTGFCQSPKMNFEEILNNEKIKKIQTRYFKSADTLNIDGRDLVIKEFDESGKLSKNYRYTFWDVVSYDHTTNYIYDSTGNLIDKTKIQEILNLGIRDEKYIAQFGDEPKNKKTNYTYNEKGNLTKEQTFSFGRQTEENKLILTSSIQYSYDSNGQLIREIGTTPNGRITFQNYTTNFEYDELNRIVKEEIIFTSEESVRLTMYKYNDKGQLTEEQTSEQGNPFQNKHFKYEYDHFGNKIKIYRYDEIKREFVVQKTYEFNNIGHILFKAENTTFQYYENGLIKQELWKSNTSDEVVNFITSYEFY